MLYMYSGPAIMVKLDNGEFKYLTEGRVVDLTEKEARELALASPGRFMPYVEDIPKAAVKAPAKKEEKKSVKGVK